MAAIVRDGAEFVSLIYGGNLSICSHTAEKDLSHSAIVLDTILSNGG